MTVKKTLGAYADCDQVMSVALSRGSIRIPFPTRGAAINFRQRCYRFRQELLKVDTPPPGAMPASRFDSLVITIPDKGSEEEAILTFRSRENDGAAILSRILDESGAPVVLEEEDFEAQAAALRNKIGLE